MRKLMPFLSALLLCLPSFACAGAAHEADATIGINIQIADVRYGAILLDNETTSALINMLPLAITMNDLNSNEKYCYLPESLPTHEERVGSIRSGDIMLYGSSCLVLFYDDFQSGYRYTRLGHIEMADGFADALGTGSVEVIISLIEPEKGRENNDDLS